MALVLALDCKHYLGDRPCRYRQRCVCAHYAPQGFRILIIKLGALGDVVRTACLLPSLKAAYPQSHITWVSKPSGVRILGGHPLIDQRVVFDAEGILALAQREFDLVLSLDKEPGPTALCNAVRSGDKRGIRMSRWGTAEPCEARCEPYFELGLDDELKFRHNRRTYPEWIHEAVGLPYSGAPYCLFCDPAALDRARRIFEPWRSAAQRAMIGLNTGAGFVFANKAPPPPWWVDLARRLVAGGYGVVLLGGPEEAERNALIAAEVGPEIHSAGTHHTEPEFVAVVDQCDAVVTGDTLALHVALARGVPVVALFGPTCEQEIDLYGLGQKVMAECDCAPCYRRQCDKVPSCMDRITPSQVAAAVDSITGGQSPRRRHA